MNSCVDDLDANDQQYRLFVDLSSDTYGIFPNICSHKLTNVYSKLKYGRLGSAKDSDIQYTISTDGIWYDKHAFSAALEDWTTHSANDYITRYARDEGTFTGYWSVVGTRVHRKCYLQALRSKEYNYNSAFLDAPDFAITADVYIGNKCITADGTRAIADAVICMYERIYDSDRETAGCPDAILLEDFTRNMMKITKAVVGDEAQVLSPECPVYWPFGLFSKREAEVGRAYETRVDLLMQSADDIILVEYKTRMEVTPHGKQIYELCNADDRLQLRLNTWMVYFNTGTMPRTSYLVQASRSQQEGKEGCVAKIELAPNGTLKNPVCMVKLITRFAIHPYGDASVARYADDRFIVPSMTHLLKALGLASGAKLQLDEENGSHLIFTQILCGSRFNLAIAKATSGHCAAPDVHLRLPDLCLTDGSNPTIAPCVYGTAQDTICRWRKFREGWHKYYEFDDDETKSAVTAAFRYGAMCGPEFSNFIPVLFSRDGADCKPILYCHVGVQIGRCDTWPDQVILAPAINPGSIFRMVDGQLPTMKYRMKSDPGSSALVERCRRDRDILNKSVYKVAKSINETLCTRGAPGWLDAITTDVFWKATTTGIYRPRLVGGHSPIIHEFAAESDEPYAPLPKSAKRVTARRQEQTRVSLLIRCIHRLINTRVLRASFALAGFSDVQYSHVSNTHEWSIEVSHTSNWVNKLCFCRK